MGAKGDCPTGGAVGGSLILRHAEAGRVLDPARWILSAAHRPDIPSSGSFPRIRAIPHLVSGRGQGPRVLRVEINVVGFFARKPEQ